MKAVLDMPKTITLTLEMDARELGSLRHSLEVALYQIDGRTSPGPHPELRYLLNLLKPEVKP